MQRNFEPMRKQMEGWQKYELTDVTAKVVIDETERRHRPGRRFDYSLLTRTNLIDLPA